MAGGMVVRRGIRVVPWFSDGDDSRKGFEDV